MRRRKLLAGAASFAGAAALAAPRSAGSCPYQRRHRPTGALQATSHSVRFASRYVSTGGVTCVTMPGMKLTLTVTGVLAAGVLAGCTSGGNTTASVTTAPATVTSSAAAAASTPPPAPLTCTASASPGRPVVFTSVTIRVRTAGKAKIKTVAHYKTGGQAQRDATGRRGRLAIVYQIGDAKPGYMVTVDVAVRKGNRSGDCTAYFTPRRQPRPVPPPAPSPAPSSAAPAPQGCYPRASSGNCYEPGEFCPHADAGMTGVAGDGKTIICENNNGLRWEPA